LLPAAAEPSRIFAMRVTAPLKALRSAANGFESWYTMTM
jgi:hypothetical protein